MKFALATILTIAVVGITPAQANDTEPKTGVVISSVSGSAGMTP